MLGFAFHAKLGWGYYFPLIVLGHKSISQHKVFTEAPCNNENEYENGISLSLEHLCEIKYDIMNILFSLSATFFTSERN